MLLCFFFRIPPNGHPTEMQEECFAKERMLRIGELSDFSIDFVAVVHEQ